MHQEDASFVTPFSINTIPAYLAGSSRFRLKAKK